MIENTQKKLENDAKTIKKQLKTLKKEHILFINRIKNIAFLRKIYEKETKQDQKGLVHFDNWLKSRGVELLTRKGDEEVGKE